MEKYVTLKGAQCYGNSMPEDWNKCVSPVVTWAMGSDGQFLPDHIGVPISGRDVYYMLEVHYDNPTLRKGEHLLLLLSSVASFQLLVGLGKQPNFLTWLIPVKVISKNLYSIKRVKSKNY